MHAVDRGVGALIKTGEKPLRGRACFVLVVLVRHGGGGPGCVPCLELHECVPHHVQDRGEVLPICPPPLVGARAILAEILVGCDKIPAKYLAVM